MRPSPGATGSLSDRRRSEPVAAHVQHRRRARADRTRAALAARLRGSKPVRIGNAASEQFQLDIFGEVLAVLYRAFELGLPRETRRARRESRSATRSSASSAWREPDGGIWEIRGKRQHFTYSKVSAWTAIDRAIKYSEATRRMRPSTAGEPLATRSMPRSLPKATTPSATRSSSTTAGRRSGCEPAAHHPRSPVFCRRTTRASWARLTRSAESARGAVRLALLDGRRRGRACRRRRGVSHLLLLAGECAGDGRAGGRSRAQPRAAHGSAKRCPAPQRGVRPAEQTPVGNFPQAFSHIGLLHAIYAISEARQ